MHGNINNIANSTEKDDVTEFTMTVPKDGGLFGGNTRYGNLHVNTVRVC